MKSVVTAKRYCASTVEFEEKERNILYIRELGRRKEASGRSSEAERYGRK